jgi:error-prone DNA polymerase
MDYAELHCRSYFSFLDAASAPEALVTQAHALGYQALALTDTDGVYGAPRAHIKARELGLPLVLGAEVTLAENETAAPYGRIVLLALDDKGYARLCRILTTARLRRPKGSACATWDEVAIDPRGLAVLSGGAQGPLDRALAASDPPRARAFAARLRDAFGEYAFVELTHHLGPHDDERLTALSQLAHQERLPRVVTQNARYALLEEKPLCDVLSCVRHKTTLARAGRLLDANAERHLHRVPELWRRFAGQESALERTVELARRARFSLGSLSYRFPAFPLPAGETPFSTLHELTMRGARERYRPITARVSAKLAHELSIIERLRLAGYFLIVWDIVRFCRDQGILCQGRGSAANSAVCYALGITAVDPIGMDLLFERFLSEERAETPDIDLDIAHQRREEVIQYVYRRYGQERVAMANEVITYHTRSALRDVGKVFGLSLAQVDSLAKAQDSLDEPGLEIRSTTASWGEARAALPREGGREGPPLKDGRVGRAAWKEVSAAEAAQSVGLSPKDLTLAHVLSFSRALSGTPRHLGIHSGGMVVSDGPMSEVVPIENAAMPGRTVVQWDKDDLASLGILKIDLLGLGMLTVLDEALRLVKEHEHQTIDLARLPPCDPQVYDLICRADTVGVFQIESRAQMSMLPRLKPRTFYDLVIEVAIIRPGPIQGEMIHPYLQRRYGKEPVVYAHPSLEPVLGRTLGVPLFQEQGMKLAITCAGFSPGEADELRRAMGHKRSRERMEKLTERLLAGMAKNGITRDAGELIVKQLTAFADYGFPESHAASFALLVYASAYLKRYHHAAFTAALLNAQPMGFYAPHTLCADAQRHGVTLLSPCAQKSAWETRIEAPSTLRLGISLVRGVGEKTERAFAAARAQKPFRSVGDFVRRSALSRTALEHLAQTGGFACFGLRRREALWQVTAAAQPQGPLLAEAELPVETLCLPAMTAREELAADYAGLGLSVAQHPLALARHALHSAGVLTAKELGETGRQGAQVAVAGMVITRQRPPTAKGMVFMTLEDETGLANLVLTPPVFERLRAPARTEPLLIAYGKVERQGSVVNLRVEHLVALEQAVGKLVRHVI